MPEMSDTEKCAPIPEDLRKLYEQACAFNMEEVSPVDAMWLIERIGKAESARDQLRIERDAAFNAGWNAAIQDAENALRESGRPQGCIKTIRGLSKPVVTPLGRLGGETVSKALIVLASMIFIVGCRTKKESSSMFDPKEQVQLERVTIDASSDDGIILTDGSVIITGGCWVLNPRPGKLTGPVLELYRALQEADKKGGIKRCHK